MLTNWAQALYMGVAGKHKLKLCNETLPPWSASKASELDYTMPAKSLGTFPVICAIDEVQNPLPLKTILFKRHMTSIIGIIDTFPNS